MIRIGEQEMHDIAAGAAILGTGGGGDPYVGKLMAITAIRKHGPVELLDPDEIPDDWLVIPTAMMGAPTVMKEKIPGGVEAIASGNARIEDDPRVDPSRTARLDREFVRRAQDKIVENVERSIDMIKTTREPVPVVLVGGGGIIVPETHYGNLKGVSRVIRPENFQYANAIGAAIAQVSGEIDRVFSLEHQSREDALKQARQMAVEKAVSAGADHGRIEIVDIDEVFLAYLPSNAARIRVKAAGPLKG